MIRELDLFGVYVSPMLALLAVTLAAWLLLRLLLQRLGAYGYVWHRALFDAALFVILLAGVVALVSPW